MSICRFSSDGFQSDVDVYESARDTFKIHVARARRPRRVCDVDFSSPESHERTLGQRIKELADKTNQPEPIGGQCDGACFVVDGLEELRNHLIYLRSKGYKVPQSAFNSITIDIRDQNSVK